MPATANVLLRQRLREPAEAARTGEVRWLSLRDCRMEDGGRGSAGEAPLASGSELDVMIGGILD